MKIAVVPASTRTTSAVIRSLLALPTPVDIKAYYRDTSKAPEEFTSHSNFEAVKGDVMDDVSLDFSGCQVVVAVPPPFFFNEDMEAVTEKVSVNVKTAIERASSVKRLVLLSSIGAHLYEGVGEIKTKTVAERVLKKTNVPSIAIIRPAYFMDNWHQQLATVKSAEPSMVSYLPPSTKLSMVAIKDVGEAAAKEAVVDVESAHPLKIYELHGPDKDGYSPTQVQELFSQSVGKDVALQDVSPDLAGFLSKMGVPAGCVPYFVDMTTCLLLPDGVVAKTPDSEAEVVYGSTTLESTISTMVAA
ncbi:hypothetical protein B0I35DRAFT_352071 [Stachybotrys elegans]|uniref:NmrA-like domain-containing protein n=1 Tax=Stachybotrys elegans TaxID=80388 RepID=A0A8K0WQY8_9HYPO|nr:hypothetical protein B0I35DRAFT_352071 [Stachybotrys elegans]